MAVHEFEPDHYHVVIGVAPPVLTLQSGDTLRTSTVDARGHDRTGQQVTPRGNPQTGPFFVEGAEIGDTLAVRFDRLAPNRRWGFTAGVVAPNVVDPDFVSQLPAGFRVDWMVDTESWTARPENPLPGLENFVLPLNPMLGCFGVAPARGQAISTATSAEHGGNMDYRGFRAGTTVYLPVAVPGALLYVGDGHAVQGDGEIVGTGIEISFDVELTVEVIKGWDTCWPRGIDEQWYFTVGNARPLDQALQHATTEMMRWLRSGFGLNFDAASVLLGQCVRYEIANVFDPAYTVVCKLERALLDSLTGRQV